MTRALTLARPPAGRPTPKTPLRGPGPQPVAPSTALTTTTTEAMVRARQTREQMALDGAAHPKLVASAAPVSIDFSSSRHYLLRRIEDQAIAIRHATQIGELGYAEDYIAKAVGGIDVFPAVIPRPGMEPERIDEASTALYDQIAWSCWADIANGFQGGLTNGVKSLLQTSAWDLGVPGEFWIHATRNLRLDRNEYEILPITMLEQGGNSGFRVRRLPGLAPDAIAADDRMFRVWTPNPTMTALAFSPVMWARDICQSILTLTEAGIAASENRLSSNGLLVIPAGMTFADTGGMQDQQTSFSQELIETVVTAIRDNRSASRWVPIVLEGEKDDIEAVRFVTMFQPEMERDAQRLEAYIKRLGVAVDMPSGWLAGFGDMTHWNAYAVDSAIWLHLAPIAENVLSGWDILWRELCIISGMPGQVASRLCLWYDASRVIAKPDLGPAATEAVKLGILRPEAFARIKGLADEDIFDVFAGLPDAQVRLMMYGAAINDAGLFATGDLAQMTGRVSTAEEMLPGDVRALKSVKPTSGAKEDLPDAAPPPAPAPPAETPPPAEPPAVTPAPGIQASAAPPPAVVPMTLRAQRIGRLGTALSRIDAKTLVTLQTMAHAELETMARKVGAQLRDTVNRHTARTQYSRDDPRRYPLKEIDNLHLAAHLGRDQTLAFATAGNVNPQQVVAEAAAAYAARARAVLARAQSQALSTVAQATDTQPDDLAAATASTRPAWLTQAESTLTAGMVAVGMSYLFHPDGRADAGARGERSDLTAPTASIREAMTVAGGGDPTGPTGTALLLGSGPMTMQAASTGGASGGDTFEWSWGGSDKPFPPHEDLDGVRFVGFDDPVLDNTEDWPGSPLIPGDHDGCSCSVRPILQDSLTPLSRGEEGD